MIFAIMIMLTALILSTVAAFYSISGLTAIFPGAVVPIIIMGGTLEISKIVATVWLHKYWNQAALQFKLYLVPAIIILMIITSTGIFGFLSAAHLSQSTANDDISSQVSLLDEKIKTEQDNIATSKQALKQMDAQVDQLLGRTDDDKGANRAVQVRKQQAKERKSLQADISIAQKNISTLQAERAPIAAKSRVAESHIGPIKYIAALIYGDNPNADLLERAVRWVIILLVFVFDPLALILILAAEQTIAWARDDKEKRKGWHQEWVPDTEAWPEWDDPAMDAINEELLQTVPAYEPDDGPLSDQQIETIKQASGVDQNKTTGQSLFGTEEEFFERGKAIAKLLDAFQKPVEPVKEAPADVNGMPAEDFIKSLHSNTAPITVAPVLQHDPEPISPAFVPLQHNGIHDPEPINLVSIPNFGIVEDNDATAVNAGFGTEFPTNPTKGDMFLRVDYLPSRPYKWNGIKWIEVDKTKSDSFAYDEAYIQHLIDKIDSGEYEVEMLTPAEQEQIQRYLNGKSNT